MSASQSSQTNINQKPPRLVRSETDRVIAGIAGGLAQYFDVDSTLIRLVFLLLFIFGGSGLLLYLAFWLIMPTASSTQKTSQQHLHENSQEIKKTAQSLAESFTKDQPRHHTGAYFLILLGTLFLLMNLNLLDWFDFEKFWPLILIGLGIALLTRRN